MTKTVCIETWGCQMNIHQSEGLVGLLERAGYQVVDRISDANIVLFNGCLVRQKAEDKVYGRIGAVVDEKRRRPVLLGVGGCLGEVRREELLRRFPAVDFVFGARGHSGLLELIEQADRGIRDAAIDHGPKLFDEVPYSRSTYPTGMVTITEGCSNYCAYCVVPFARGPMRSRDVERILDEVRDLVAQEYREVLLLGQNVNAYGTDRNDVGSFVELLRAVVDTGIQRVRFTSSHPRDLQADVFVLMKELPSICPHIHLACQSGSDRILGQMNRGYTRREFLELVSTGRKVIPHLNVTTDLIVGFPGETDADFEETLSLLDEACFGTVFAAMYSERPLTKASHIPDDVPQELKSERLHRLLDRQRQIALAENERFVGGEVEVLIEGVSRNGAAYGRARDHRTVLIDQQLEKGQTVRATVEAASAAALSGVMCPEGQGDYQ